MGSTRQLRSSPSDPFDPHHAPSTVPITVGARFQSNRSPSPPRFPPDQAVAARSDLAIAGALPSPLRTAVPGAGTIRMSRILLDRRVSTIREHLRRPADRRSAVSGPGRFSSAPRQQSQDLYRFGKTRLSGDPEAVGCGDFTGHLPEMATRSRSGGLNRSPPFLAPRVPGGIGRTLRVVHPTTGPTHHRSRQPVRSDPARIAGHPGRPATGSESDRKSVHQRERIAE